MVSPVGKAGYFIANHKYPKNEIEIKYFINLRNVLYSLDSSKSFVFLRLPNSMNEGSNAKIFTLAR